jgi:hypothetical protein
MSRFDRVLSWIENFLAAATLGAASALAIIAVILRYVFDYVIFWSSEAVIYLIIFSTYLGAVITLRHGEHVNIDILPFLFGRRGKRAVHNPGLACHPGLLRGHRLLRVALGHRAGYPQYHVPGSGSPPVGRLSRAPNRANADVRPGFGDSLPFGARPAHLPEAEESTYGEETVE